MSRHSVRIAAVMALTAAPAFVASAQQTATGSKAPSKSTLDRTVVPAAGSTPELHVPTWTKTTLANGAQLVVSEKHALPLVSFQINFVGGANQFEPTDKTGLASLVASMLTEETSHRSGDQIATDLQRLGTSVSVVITPESGRLSFTSTKDKFAPTLAILADLLENPTDTGRRPCAISVRVVLSIAAMWSASNACRTPRV